MQAGWVVACITLILSLLHKYTHTHRHVPAHLLPSYLEKGFSLANLNTTHNLCWNKKELLYERKCQWVSNTQVMDNKDDGF